MLMLRRLGLRRRSPLCLAVCGGVLVLVLTISVYSSLLLFPELRMISNSQCKNPLQSWNGKLLSYQIWKSGFDGRPLFHNIHFRHNATNDRRRLLSLSANSTSADGHRKERIILWGAHHKTGTYLAQKVFAVICARMKWCCVFHPTRDSIDAIHDVFATEPVSIIGHNQWIWYPEEIAGDKDYKFVHFYRNPVKKIVSGYRYHREGAETWTTASKPYAQVCRSSLFRQSIGAPDGNSTTATATAVRKKSAGKSGVGRSDVVDHCKAVQLCVTCCRREHEKGDSIHFRRYSAGVGAARRASPGATANSSSSSSSSSSKREYFLRPAGEYSYLCQHLGTTTTSLRDRLRAVPPAEGLATEAALHLYESLRMARIVNHTFHDPRSLNIDLEDLTRDAMGFQATIWMLLKHLQLGLSDSELTSLSREIDFYNIKNSQFYKWSMTMPLVNSHLDTTAESKEWTEMLVTQPEFQATYKPVFDLMREAI